MTHRDFDAARRAYNTHTPDPVTFTLAGELFECLLDPSIGDTFEMADAPDITSADFDPANQIHLALMRKIARYIQRMLPVDDRPRFDAALYRIPLTHLVVVLEIAEYITKEVVDRPTEPPASFSSGRPNTGLSAKSDAVGASRSS